MHERINTNTYILNLEAAYIYKDIHESKKTITENKDKDKIFTATMPHSIETIRAKQFYNDEYYKIDSKEYTKLFLNLNFDKDYFIKDENNRRNIVAKKSEIRKKLYVDGITVDGQHYVFFKRSSGKAKQGSAIFVKDYARDKLIDRGNLNIKFAENEEIDLTSIQAYQSLIMSGIDFTIDLKAEEILIIDDIYGKEFKSWASVTEEIKGELVTHDKEISIRNCLSDGHSLLDESVFLEYEKSDKGFMLLRSDWLKSCAFNTKLQAFWQEKEVKQIVEKLSGEATGRILDTSKIKLVITPNSLKWLKLSKSKFNGDQVKCYLYWLENIDTVFGVVKTDKQGNFGTYNRSTYQLLNSLPLNKEDIKKIASLELDYVRSLKDDFAVFKNYIGIDENITANFERDIDYVNNYRPEAVLVENKYNMVDLLNNLLLVNSNFQYTKKFKEYKKRQIGFYVENLRKGKLRLKDTIYATIVSNPYEMLLATIDEFKEGAAIASGREMYCQYYQGKYTEFCVSRNPHINQGNVIYMNLKWHDEYKWFNLTDNIMIVNFNDNDLPQRAQGEDTDSDTNLIIPHKTFVEKAKECENRYYTPINMVEGDKKTRYNNMLELAELDNTLSNNYIGKIVNKSQILNSYLWNCIKNGEDDGLIKTIYNQSSKCSSLSQIEIDKSKKTFDNISMAKELTRINSITYNNNPILTFKYYKIINGEKIEIEKTEYNKIKENNSKIVVVNNIARMLDRIKNLEKRKNNDEITKRKIIKIDETINKVKCKIINERSKIDESLNVDANRIEVIKRMIVPKFFDYVALDNSNRELVSFDTPMDYLQEVIDEVIKKKPKKTLTYDFKDLLLKQKELKGVNNTKQEQEILDIIKVCGKKLSGLNNKSCILNETGKDTVRKNSRKEAIKNLKKLKITSNTILSILKQAFGVTDDKYGFAYYSMLTLDLFYYSHMFATLGCFKNTNASDDKVLVLDDNGDINIFGSKYKKVTQSSIGYNYKYRH